MAKLTANGNSIIYEINGISNQFKSAKVSARFNGLNIIIRIDDIEWYNGLLTGLVDANDAAYTEVGLQTLIGDFNSGGGGGAIEYLEANANSIQVLEAGDPVLVNNLTLTATSAGVYNVNSSIQFANVPANVTSLALASLNTLITEIQNLTVTSTAHTAAFGAGEILTAGVYSQSTATTHTGNIVFDGQNNANATFVVLCGAAHAIAAGATATLINGAQSSNIFWLVTGALTFGAGANLFGTYISFGAVAPATLTLEGRVLTTTGALASAGTYVQIPTGTTTLDLGAVEDFILFTGAGAVSNTLITGLVGDVGTNLGAITGFAPLNGCICTADSTSSKICFEVYANGIAVPNSKRTFFSGMHNAFNLISINSLATVAVNQEIQIFVEVLSGTITLENRNSFALKIA